TTKEMREAGKESMPLIDRSPAMTIAIAVTEPTDRQMPPKNRRINMTSTTTPWTKKAIAKDRQVLLVEKEAEAKNMTKNNARKMRISRVARMPSRRFSECDSPRASPFLLSAAAAAVMELFAFMMPTASVRPLKRDT